MCGSHLAHLTSSIDAIRSLLLEKAGWTSSKAGAVLQKLAILTDRTFPFTDTFSAISNTLFALATNPKLQQISTKNHGGIVWKQGTFIIKLIVPNY